MALADRLRQRRKQLKLTQAQLAEKAGMTQQTVQQLETRKVLSTGRIVDLAAALGVRPEWLAEEKGPMQGSDFTQEERELVAEYRELDPDKQSLIQMTIRALLPSGTTNAHRKIAA